MKSMDELLRLGPPKQKCSLDGCPSVAYWNGIAHLCVICDDEQFELCLDCERLRGWCTCEGREEHVPEQPVVDAPTHERVVDVLVEAGGPVRPLDLHRRIPRGSAQVNAALKQLLEQGMIHKVKHGYYAAGPAPRGGR